MIHVSRNALLQELRQHKVTALRTRPFVLLGYDGGSVLKIDTTDLELALTSTTGVDEPADEPAWQAAVNVKNLLEVVASSSADALALSKPHQEALDIADPMGKTQLFAYPADEAHAMPDEKPEQEVDLRLVDLQRCLRQAAPAIGEEGARYQLQGILLQAADGRLEAVATDGNRLHWSSCPTERGELSTLAHGSVYEAQGGAAKRSLLLHGRAASLVGGWNGDVAVSVACGKRQLAISADGHGLLRCRATEAAFPDFRRAMDKELPHSVVVDREELEEAARRAAVVSLKDTGAGKKTTAVKLTVDENEGLLEGANPDRGEATLSIARHGGSGPRVELGLQAAFIVDFCRLSDAEQLVLRYGTEKDQISIDAAGEEPGFRAVIMPLRL